MKWKEGENSKICFYFFISTNFDKIFLIFECFFYNLIKLCAFIVYGGLKKLNLKIIKFKII